MRIAELSQATGVPVPTIKYYLREGLLRPGERTAVNQARYGEGHVRRLRLIRVLREVADLSVARIGEILAAVDDESLSLHQVLGVAHAALEPRPADEDDQLAEARREVDSFLDRLGWAVSPDAPARRSLAQTLVRLRTLGQDVGPQALDVYAEAADTVAAWELDHLDAAGGDRERRVERAVVGTVVYEAAFAALRRLAQEHHSARRFGGRWTS